MTMSRRERKQYRKELFRKVERRRRLVWRVALVLGIISLIGLVAAVGVSLTDVGIEAIWIAGPTGGVILTMAGVLGAGAIMARRQKRRMSFIGWAGLVWACIAGLQLITALMLLVAGHPEASDLTGLFALLPVLLAIGFFGSEWTKDVPGNDNPVDSLSTIIR